MAAAATPAAVEAPAEAVIEAPETTAPQADSSEIADKSKDVEKELLPADAEPGIDPLKGDVPEGPPDAPEVPPLDALSKPKDSLIDKLPTDAMAKEGLAGVAPPEAKSLSDMASALKPPDLKVPKLPDLPELPKAPESLLDKIAQGTKPKS